MERVLAFILNKYLLGFIDEVDYNNLKVGFFSGALELNNLKIKQGALVSFKNRFKCLSQAYFLLLLSTNSIFQSKLNMEKLAN